MPPRANKWATKGKVPVAIVAIDEAQNDDNNTDVGLVLKKRKAHVETPLLVTTDASSGASSNATSPSESIILISSTRPDTLNISNHSSGNLDVTYIVQGHARATHKKNILSNDSRATR
jgi:hypothetical protein